VSNEHVHPIFREVLRMFDTNPRDDEPPDQEEYEEWERLEQVCPACKVGICEDCVGRQRCPCTHEPRG